MRLYQLQAWPRIFHPEIWLNWNPGSILRCHIAFVLIVFENAHYIRWYQCRTGCDHYAVRGSNIRVKFGLYLEPLLRWGRLQVLGFCLSLVSWRLQMYTWQSSGFWLLYGLIDCDVVVIDNLNFSRSLLFAKRFFLGDGRNRSELRRSVLNFIDLLLQIACDTLYKVLVQFWLLVRLVVTLLVEGLFYLFYGRKLTFKRASRVIPRQSYLVNGRLPSVFLD